MCPPTLTAQTMNHSSSETLRKLFSIVEALKSLQLQNSFLHQNTLPISFTKHHTRHAIKLWRQQRKWNLPTTSAVSTFRDKDHVAT